MLKALFQRFASDQFDARVAEWIAACGALLLLVCGYVAIERLRLFGVERLAGYGLILVLTLLLANLAVLFSIRAAIGGRDASEPKP